MHRFWFFLSLLLVFVLLLAACEEVPIAEEEVVEEVVVEQSVEEPEETQEEEAMEEPAAPETLRLLLVSRGDASDTAADELATVAAEMGIEVEIEFVDPGVYMETLRTRIAAGEELPDMVELTNEQLPFVVDSGMLVPLVDYVDRGNVDFAVFGRQVDDELYTMRWSPDFCYSYLGVLAMGNEEIAFSLLEALAGRTGDDCTSVAFPDTEVWIPYSEQPPPEVIGDATLVPGHPAILFAISELEGYLQEQEVAINSARAVVLREPFPPDEFEESDFFETTYFAPVGPEVVQGDEGTIIGVVFLEAGEVELPLEPGAYAVRLTPDYSLVEYVDPSQFPVHGEGASIEEDQRDDIPTAGILLGTKTCRAWIPIIGWITYPCGWF